MPNALLEAMIMGVPSVAYAIPPVIELEGDSGGVLLVPTGNTEKLAEAILNVSVRPEERTRLGEKGKARANANFMVKKNMMDALQRLEGLVRKSKLEKPADKDVKVMSLPAD